MLELGGEDVDADVCVEGWAQHHTVGNIAIVTSGVAEGC